MFRLLLLFMFIAQFAFGQIEIFKSKKNTAKLAPQGSISLDLQGSSLQKMCKLNSVEVVVPTSEGDKTLVLRKVNVFEPYARIFSASGVIYDLKKPLVYAGYVKDRIESLATIVTDGKKQVRGFIEDGSKFILDGDGKTHYIVNQAQTSLDSTYKLHEPLIPPNSINSYNYEQQSSGCKKVKVYFELDYDLFQKKGGVQQSIDFFTSLFAQVQQIYKNDGMNIVISAIKVWDIQDPYPSADSYSALIAFTNSVTNFDGDIAHLVSTKGGNNGGIAWLSTLCNKQYAKSYSNIASSFANYPTYSWSVMVVAHELGHNIASPHTHSCTWKNGAIDGCYTPEGGCAKPEIPSDGGTIMSYCHLTTAGINFAKGFGDQPKNLMLSKIAAAPCLSGCDDDGGSEDYADLTRKLDNIDIVNANVSATIQVQNVGKIENRKCLLRVYASKDSKVSFEDVQFYQDSIPVLRPSQFTTFQFSKTPTLPDGEYFVVYKIDSDNSVSESDEANNEYFFQEKLVIGNKDDSYCQAKGSLTTYEWINLVEINGKQFQSGNNNGYLFNPSENEVNTSVPLILKITPGFNGGNFLQEFRVWVDADGDKNFEKDELFAEGQGISTVTYSLDLSKVKVDLARTRIGMRFKQTNGADFTACGTQAYGEFEDYVLRFKKGCNVPTIREFCYVDGFLKISFDNVLKDATFRYRTAIGGAWQEEKITDLLLIDADYVEIQTKNTCSDWSVSAFLGKQ